MIYFVLSNEGCHHQRTILCNPKSAEFLECGLGHPFFFGTVLLASSKEMTRLYECTDWTVYWWQKLMPFCSSRVA